MGGPKVAREGPAKAIGTDWEKVTSRSVFPTSFGHTIRPCALLHLNI